MRVVGLTGGIATGKSSAAALLRERGYTVIDCDAIAHEVCAKGRWGYRRVLSAFGRSALEADGQLDREAIARLVFADAGARRRLEAATHLPVAAELLKRLAAAWLRGEYIVIVEMPLLMETGAHRLMSTCIVVATEPEVQVRRLKERDGCSEADARARLAAQMALKDRVALAQVVLDNNGTPQQLKQQVDEIAGPLRSGTTLPGMATSPLAVALWLAAAALFGPRLVAALLARAGVKAA